MASTSIFALPPIDEEERYLAEKRARWDQERAAGGTSVVRVPSSPEEAIYVLRGAGHEVSRGTKPTLSIVGATQQISQLRPAPVG
jgi:hypothetical protein